MRSILLACLSLLVLAACGIKGPLYLPTPRPAPTTPLPAATVPDSSKAPATAKPEASAPAAHPTAQ